MRQAALVLIGAAFIASLFLLWRVGQAAADRDNQPADSNDVAVTIAAAASNLALALMAVVFAILS